MIRKSSLCISYIRSYDNLNLHFFFFFFFKRDDFQNPTGTSSVKEKFEIFQKYWFFDLFHQIRGTISIISQIYFWVQSQKTNFSNLLSSYGKKMVIFVQFSQNLFARITNFDIFWRNFFSQKISFLKVYTET